MILVSPLSRSSFPQAAALALVSLLLFSGCSEKTEQAAGGGGGRGGRGGRGGASGPAPVLVAKAQTKVVPLTLEAIGAVEPSRTAAVRSQVTGTLLKIFFQEGQDVKQGDLLFQIDPRPFQNALQSAQADLQKVQVQLDTARTQVARYRTLTEAMVSKEQLQTVLDSERVLTAQLMASKSALDNAQLQLDNSSIRAPLPGRSGSVGAHEGDLIRASDAAPLVTIHQLSPISVNFGVPQQYLTPLARYRAQGEIAVNAVPPGTTAADSAPEKGTLIFIDNAVDSSSGTIKLKASFPNDAHRLWPGQFANISIMLASPQVLVVPASAVESDQSGQHVFVVKSDNTAEFRKIVVERTVHDEAVVTSGLADGETVVSDGQLRVVPGKPVDIKSPDGTSGPGGAPGRGDGAAKKKGKEKAKTS